MTKKQPQAKEIPIRSSSYPKEIYKVTCQSTDAGTKSTVLEELILKEYWEQQEKNGMHDVCIRVGPV